MKHLKRFIVLAMVLGIGGILLMRVPATQFRGQDSQELTRHYNLLKQRTLTAEQLASIVMTGKWKRTATTKSGCQMI